MKLNILSGEKFGKLTVVKEAEAKRLPSGQINRIFLCKCDCGNYKEVRLLHLKRNRISSCGCIVKTRKGESSTYLCKVWREMKYRCLPNYFENHLYFKKGITVCNEWADDYFIFKKWAIEAGYNRGLQIDRINNSKGYSPNNCRFVTPSVNVNNRDNTFYVFYNNKKQALTPLLREKNLIKNISAIKGRIKRGWDVNKAIDTPIKSGNYYNTGYKHKELKFYS